MSDVEIRITRFGAPAARALVAAAQADLATRYGSGDDTPVDPVEFDPPEGCFFVAWQRGEPVACGGWRTHPRLRAVDPTEAAGLTEAVEPTEAAEDGLLPLDPTRYVAELKRMYVVPGARGAGVAAALLTAIEESAREHGLRRMVLETGTRQPEAIRFYAKNGYERIPDYGYYKGYTEVRSFARDL